MNKTYFLALAALALLGCTPDPSPITMQAPPQYTPPPAPAPAPAPVVVQQDSGTGNMLAAGAIGYMAGSALSNNNSRGYDRDYDRRPQVVHRTTVIKKTIIQRPKQAYAYKPTARKVTVTKTYTSSKRR